MNYITLQDRDQSSIRVKTNLAALSNEDTSSVAFREASEKFFPDFAPTSSISFKNVVQELCKLPNERPYSVEVTKADSISRTAHKFHVTVFKYPRACANIKVTVTYGALGEYVSELKHFKYPRACANIKVTVTYGALGEYVSELKHTLS